MGLWPRKGGIHVGADADIALWDPAREVTLTKAHMQHAIDHTPTRGGAWWGGRCACFAVARR